VAFESESNLRLEIGHVLFIDLVGYSKLLIEEQKERLGQLTNIVLATAQVREAPNEQLIRLPTGDGMALVFRNSSEEPARCALEIAKALKAHPAIAVRMGIHSGPVSEVTDVSGRSNIAGAGINLAQRVMDCGDAGHILLSRRVAEDLEQYRQWQPRLHDLGECEVKHGVRLHLVNLYAEQLGNPALPTKFREGIKTQQAALPGSQPKRNKLVLIAAVVVVFMMFCLAIVVLIFAPAVIKSVSRHRAAATPRQTSVASSLDAEKSVAVLPFVNMSGDKTDEYLSDGMTEELINALTKVKELRVPGRSSSFAFKGKNAEDIFRKVGEGLHVKTVLEGSVRKAGDKLRVTAQLINVADGYHIWSEDYDGSMKDILVFQGDVAKQVVDALQLQLGVDEARALAKRPTENPEAQRLYLRGRYYFAQFTQDGWTNAIRDFEQALQLDQKFALAYCGRPGIGALSVIPTGSWVNFRKPSRPCGSWKICRRSATSRLRALPAFTSGWVSTTGPWIGWRKLLTIGIPSSGGLAATSFTTACAIRRVSRRLCRRSVSWKERDRNEP
jgi:TolB-like protein